MKDMENSHWTMNDIAHQYKVENSEWSWKQCWNKAREVYKELNRLNINMYNNDKTFFNMNTPFTFFESENGELSSIPELDGI